MNRYLSIFILFASLSVALFAEPIDEAAARLTASRFLSTSGRLKAVGGITLKMRSKAAYLFRSGSGQFILTAADDRFPEVLGYGNFSGADVPPQLSYLLASYDHVLDRMPEHRAYAIPAETLEPVAPLLTTIRDQGSPFNSSCPFYKYNDGTVSEEHCEVGCVATALEQILTYYRRDYVLQEDLIGWETEHYIIPNVPKGSHVDSRLIANDYSGQYTQEQVDAVATLSYWLGVAVKMNWTVGSSSARSENAAEPLKNAFGFKYAVYVDSYNYDPTDWVQMIRNEIRQRRPVYYAGSVMRLGGHAFVLDGYDADGYFHVNWAYDGHYDGYFNLAVLNYSEPKGDESEVGYENGFFCNQEALLLCPDAVDVQLPEAIERTGEEISLVEWHLLETPVMTTYTPMSITLRNTSQHSLTTPLEFFTNLQTDEDIFKEGDYVGLTSVTLQPGEECTQTIHLRFDADGERILRMSPDDEHYIDLGMVSIEPYHGESFSIAAPVLNFRPGQTLDVSIELTNLLANYRFGGRVVYELIHEGFDVEGTRHFHYVYADNGATVQDAASFQNLEAGDTYRLLVRCPWRVQHEVAFVMPETAGLEEIETDEGVQGYAAGPWYSISGLRVKTPTYRGVFIRDRKKFFVK